MKFAIAALTFWIIGMAQALAQVPTPAQERRLTQALVAYSEDRHADAGRAFEALARQGVGLAQFNLGAMLMRGEWPHVTQTPSAARRQEARRWLERAATNRVVLAHHMLAQWHEQGAGGRINLPEANRWLASGAALGHVDAQVDFATNLFMGRGLKQDLPRAAHWFREAAKAGDAGAQYLLAGQYEHGDGVAVDERLALYWYGQAAAQGDVAAAAKRDALHQRLTPKP